MRQITQYAIGVPFPMIFIETPIFTRQVKEALPDDEYRLLQLLLALHPDAGELINGGGGIRKVRWALPGRGDPTLRRIR